MAIGDLKHRVTIQTVAREQNSVGQLVETWSDLTTVWTKKEDGGGTEAEKSDIVTATQRTNFYVRFRAIDATGYRLKFNGLLYDIEAVDEVEFKSMLRLRCKQRSSV